MGSAINQIADTHTKIPGGNGLFSHWRVFGGRVAVASLVSIRIANPGFTPDRCELNRVIDSSVSLGDGIISSLT